MKVFRVNELDDNTGSNIMDPPLLSLDEATGLLNSALGGRWMEFVDDLRTDALQTVAKVLSDSDSHAILNSNGSWSGVACITPQTGKPSINEGGVWMDVKVSIVVTSTVSSDNTQFHAASLGALSAMGGCQGPILTMLPFCACSMESLDAPDRSVVSENLGLSGRDPKRTIIVSFASTLLLQGVIAIDVTDTENPYIISERYGGLHTKIDDAALFSLFAYVQSSGDD